MVPKLDPVAVRANAKDLAIHYALRATRIYQRLLVREALYDGRFKKERRVRAMLIRWHGLLDARSCLLSRIYTQLHDPSVRAVA